MERGKKHSFCVDALVLKDVLSSLSQRKDPRRDTGCRKKQWRPGGYAEDQDFAELVALGAASAEALLAKIHGRAIDFAKCHYLFETAPQELPDGTHSRVGFLWQWKKKPADENTQSTEEYQISIANINHLL